MHNIKYYTIGNWHFFYCHKGLVSDSSINTRATIPNILKLLVVNFSNKKNTQAPTNVGKILEMIIWTIVKGSFG